MADQLSTLRTRLKSKVNQVSADTNLVWTEAIGGDFDIALAAGVRQVLLFGGLALIQEGGFVRTGGTYSGTTISHLGNKGSGYANKPSKYFRYVNAEVDGKWVEKYIPTAQASEYNKIDGNQFLEADSEKKYLIDISGTEFLIYPTTWSETKLTFIRELEPFAADSDVTMLTYTGNDHAVDWAFAVLLESKNYRPELSDRIFARVDKIIRST